MASWRAVVKCSRQCHGGCFAAAAAWAMLANVFRLFWCAHSTLLGQCHSIIAFAHCICDAPDPVESAQLDRPLLRS